MEETNTAGKVRCGRRQNPLPWLALVPRSYISKPLPLGAILVGEHVLSSLLIARSLLDAHPVLSSTLVINSDAGGQNS